jgi:pilus assembly protein Flp/PilA
MKCGEILSTSNPSSVFNVGKMNKLAIKLVMRLDGLRSSESGQDLVEYALVVALIAFGEVTAMKSLSGGINTAFTKISATLSANIT